MDEDFWARFYHQYKLRPVDEWELALSLLGCSDPYRAKEFLSMVMGTDLVQVDINHMGLGESMCVERPMGHITYESPGRWR